MTSLGILLSAVTATRENSGHGPDCNFNPELVAAKPFADCNKLLPMVNPGELFV